MKKIAFIMTICVFLLFSIEAQAKDYSSKLKSTDFTQLSDKDMEDTIDSLIKKISKDLGIVHTPVASYYEYDWAVLAHNTLIPIGETGPTISVNLSGFKTATEAETRGITVSYLLVQTIAHEVRHSFQYEHQNDDSDYGRACYNGINNYNSWYKDIGAYYSQWLEQDANEYANQYVERYFK